MGKINIELEHQPIARHDISEIDNREPTIRIWKKRFQRKMWYSYFRRPYVETTRTGSPQTSLMKWSAALSRFHPSGLRHAQISSLMTTPREVPADPKEGPLVPAVLCVNVVNSKNEKKLLFPLLSFYRDISYRITDGVKPIKRSSWF